MLRALRLRRARARAIHALTHTDEPTSLILARYLGEVA